MAAIRMNYATECEAAVNKQVNLELHAFYVYTSMSFYFDRDDVALPGFAKYFKEAAAEERDHADQLMTFQNKRGGRVLLKDIPKPEQDEWGTCLDAVKGALELEKTVNQSLLTLHALADSQGDGQMSDFLDDFLQEQVDGIKKLADFVSRLARAGTGLGEVILDKELAG